MSSVERRLEDFFLDRTFIKAEREALRPNFLSSDLGGLTGGSSTVGAGFDVEDFFCSPDASICNKTNCK